MNYFKINSTKPDEKILQKAADVIKSGGVIVYPTDTLYGLGVDIYNKNAMDRLYYLKGRNINKPVSILVNDLIQIERLAGKLSKSEYAIANLFFPGKMTLIMHCKEKITIPRMSHLTKLGFRIPALKLTKRLIEFVGSPISTTSVNISSQKNAENLEEILALFGDKIDLILDVGSLSSEQGSSVLDLTTNPPTLLRQGEISRSEIENKLGYEVSTNYNGKFTITFVCSGNICRSPIAEGILKNLIAKTKYKNIVEINSAGTLKLPQAPAHLNAIKVSESKKINLNDHISRHINSKIIREANLIVAMALDHFTYLRNRYPDFKEKTILIKQWQLKEKLTNPSIADPIGHNETYFKNTFNEIAKEIKRISPFLLNQLKNYTKQNGLQL